MGAGMAKFICKEVETIDDLNEYVHYVAGLVVIGLSKLFRASGLEDLTPDPIASSVGLLLQNANIIRDYLEDINEIPKPRMFWPTHIWINYVDKLEDLKYEENSVKALHCLNEMVTNALVHLENCLKGLSSFRDPAIFRFYATPQVMAIGTLALCYNNIEVYRGAPKLRPGLIAQVLHQTRTMSDVYGAFFEFTSVMKAKVGKNDPNASLTLSRLEAIQKICRDSGLMNNRKFYIVRSDQGFCNSALGVIISIALCTIFAYILAIN
ncbi:Squalene synthase [Quillaja saponaria]|nr:Squalene synthase [Quillaja saponaria]